MELTVKRVIINSIFSRLTFTLLRKMNIINNIDDVAKMSEIKVR